MKYQPGFGRSKDMNTHDPKDLDLIGRMRADEDVVAAFNPRFELDPEYEHKLLMTGCPEGFLRCVAG